MHLCRNSREIYILFLLAAIVNMLPFRSDGMLLYSSKREIFQHIRHIIDDRTSEKKYLVFPLLIKLSALIVHCFCLWLALFLSRAQCTMWKK